MSVWTQGVDSSGLSPSCNSSLSKAPLLDNGISIDSESDNESIFNFEPLPPLEPLEISDTKDSLSNSRNQLEDNCIRQESNYSQELNDDDEERYLYEQFMPPQNADFDVEWLENTYPEECSLGVLVGIDPLIKRYLYERPELKVIKGTHHIILKREILDKFDAWRYVQEVKYKRRGIFVPMDTTLKHWIKSSERDATYFQSREKDGWIFLSTHEKDDYAFHCFSTWTILKSKFDRDKMI